MFALRNIEANRLRLASQPYGSLALGKVKGGANECLLFLLQNEDTRRE